MLQTRIRDIIGISAVILIAVFAVLVFKMVSSGDLDGLRGNFSDDFDDLRLRAKIFKENTRDLISPPRKQPISSLIAQETLKQALKYPFADFEDEDWEYFWDLIYGVHETDDYGVNYTPKRKRQLSIEEIQEILEYDYPKVFPRFSANSWEGFWKIVFQKRDK